MTGRIGGLYAVTPDTTDTERLLVGTEAALAGGASLLQYRNKAADGALRRRQGSALLGLCRRYGVPFIVNDDLELALELGADGVHLGAGDGPLADARYRLGGALLGVSCYDRLESAHAARRNGADYIAFGSFFPSAVKPGAVRAPLGLLGAAKQQLAGLPVVAIGGITLENAPRLVAAGADAIAVISALYAVPDVRAAAREFSALFRGSGL